MSLWYGIPTITSAAVFCISCCRLAFMWWPLDDAAIDRMPEEVGT